MSTTPIAVTEGMYLWTYKQGLLTHNTPSGDSQTTQTTENAEMGTSCQGQLAGTQECPQRVQNSERVFSESIEIPLTKGYVC